MTCEELCVPPVITFSPNGGKPEESDGTQIFEDGIDRCQARDEKAQSWHAEERPLGPEGQEPQTGDCDRTVGGEGQGQEGAEEGCEEAEDREEEDGEKVEAEGEAVARSLPSLPATNAKRLRKGAKRRSNPESRWGSGLLRFARNDERVTPPCGASPSTGAPS
jgi:hypothetical protein